MNITLDESKLAADVQAAIESAKQPTEFAMAARFHEITLSNFGIAGPDRPNDWPGLAPATIRAYRRRKPPVMREIATLVLTGALKAAVHQDGNRVYASNAEVPYATRHQNGDDKMPKRGYFPIREDGTCLPWTLGEVSEAGQNEINEKL